MILLNVPSPTGGLVFSSIALAVVLAFAIWGYFFTDQLYRSILFFKGLIRRITGK